MKLPSQTELVLLSLLEWQEMTGVGLAERYREINGIVLPVGTLYTLLRRLRAAGWVEWSWAYLSDARMKQFRLSGKGRRLLPTAREIWVGITELEGE